MQPDDDEMTVEAVFTDPRCSGNLVDVLRQEAAKSEQYEKLSSYKQYWHGRAAGLRAAIRLLLDAAAERGT